MSAKKEKDEKIKENSTDAAEGQDVTDNSIIQENGMEETVSEDTINQETVWENKYHEMNDKYLRLYSEFDNYRKRTAREKIEVISTASGNLIKNLLPIIDDFDRAIKANKESEDTEALKDGFGLIRQKMMNILSNEGLQPMDALEKEFDTEHHEAITQIPAPKKKLKGKVVDVIEKGYFLNDRVLRFAKVVIGS